MLRIRARLTALNEIFIPIKRENFLVAASASSRGMRLGVRLD